MSTKLQVGKEHATKLCDQLRDQIVVQYEVKKGNLLDKKDRGLVTQKMKGLLTNITELQQKYIELPEYKKNSCLTVNQAVPKLKIDDKKDEALSDAKQEQIRLNNRKRRRFKNSFFYADNLV